MLQLPDPRVAASASDALRPLHDLAVRVLEAPTGDVAEAANREMVALLRARLRPDGPRDLAALLAAAPSVAVHRLLWRTLHDLLVAHSDGGLRSHVFAIPVVIVAGSGSAATLPGIVPDIGRVGALLRERGGLGGSQTLALGNALVGAGGLDADVVVELVTAPPERQRELLAGARFAPVPVNVEAGQEQAHLRFLFGTVLAAPAVDPFRASDLRAWGAEFTREMGSQLRAEGVTALALARPLQPPLGALREGLVAQREVALQLFAGAALRQLRSRFGEPSAVLSAHRLEGGAGEVRVSLSSTVADLPAEGARLPLYPFDRVEDLVKTVADLLADCRVGDVVAIAQPLPDRDPGTGRTLLVRADEVASIAARGLQ